MHKEQKYNNKNVNQLLFERIVINNVPECEILLILRNFVFRQGIRSLRNWAIIDIHMKL